MKELDELEQSEGLFDENDLDRFSGSDTESDSKLSESLEDITMDLKRRADSATNVLRT